MAAALRATCAERAAAVVRLARLRDRLVDGLLAAVPDAFENVENLPPTEPVKRARRPRRRTPSPKPR